MATSQQQQTPTWDKMEILQDADPQALIWASRGGDGSGKSYFACTAPGPIYVAAFDPNGLDRVDKAIRREREIRIGRFGFNANVYDGNRKDTQAAADKIWQKFKEEYRAAIRSGKCRTALWDREDLAWELIRYANFGGDKNEGSKTGALDYGDLNAEYVGLIQEARDNGVNLGLLQGVKEKWVAKYNPVSAKMQNYNTGELIPDGFKKIADHVDITLDHFWDEKERKYAVKMVKFPNVEHKYTVQHNLDFPLMASLAFPDADLALWCN